MAFGAFSLVLHGHLPWVLGHGRWPHGEDWLYEAASETWLPLLEVLQTLRAEGVRPAWTVGIMPILMEQLRNPRFEEGFSRFLDEHAARAELDAATFREAERLHLAWLADRHAVHFRAQSAAFDAMGRDIVGALAAADVEILSSNATHGFMPLILHDACSRAQVRAGLATSERHLGYRPRGVWLPECAYRPPGWWRPPAVHGDDRFRAGVASVFGDEGVQYFFVDSALFEGARCEAVLDGPHVEPVPWDHDLRDWRRAWRSPLEPHRVAEAGVITNVAVLARSPEASEQVWSGEIGYPGDPRYLEFHKRHGMRGLRYWRVTGRQVDLGGKDVYYPDASETAVREHAAHFAGLVREKLRAHHAGTGRYGVVCAPFDAELFGHWWNEGPAFLREVSRSLHADPDVDVLTAGEVLDRVPPDKAVALPEGTWGANNDHSVWLNGELRFYWEVAYRAEDRFLDLWHRADWERVPAIRELLTEAGRQLLLLQASDWPFVISTRGAVDYGMRRILEHSARFDDLCNGVEDVILGRPPDPVIVESLSFCRVSDPVFPDLDLRWWT